MEGVAVILGVVVLGLAIAYALVRSRRRDRGLDAAGEQATRQVYENYEGARRDEANAPNVLKR